MTDSNP